MPPPLHDLHLQASNSAAPRARLMWLLGLTEDSCPRKTPRGRGVKGHVPSKSRKRDRKGRCHAKPCRGLRRCQPPRGLTRVWVNPPSHRHSCPLTQHQQMC